MRFARMLLGTRLAWLAAALVVLLAAALALYAPQTALAQSPSLTATVNDDRSVTLTLADGPSDWWFKINSWGTCTAASGTTVSNIRGYQAGIHAVAAYSDSGCQQHLDGVEFTIPTTTLATTVNSDRSVGLALTGGPSNWWFRINSGGTCTAASGTTVSGIQGYKGGTYNVWAYSDGGCSYHIASSSFTLPYMTISAVVNDDRSVTLTLTNGPSNWWFRIGGGSCTAVTGTTVSGISGYQPDTYPAIVYNDSNCKNKITYTNFTIPPATLAATVNNDRSVTLALTGGPSSWWFKINYWGTCTAATGTTVGGIRGYQSGAHDVVAYSDSGCQSIVASSSFTIPTATLAATVNNDRSVDLTLTNGPSNWWFRINSDGTCTTASGTTVSGIQGYQPGAHSVWAYSDSGCSYHIASSSFTMPALPVPDAPASVVGYRGNTFIDVEWTAVTDATSYDVDIRHEYVPYPTRAASGVTGTSYKITGLSNLGRFYVYARANNSYGSSAWTASERVPTGDFPMEPTAITTAREGTTLTVSWTMCDMSVDWCNGWSPVTGYFVETSSDGGSTWTRTHTLTSYTSGQALTVSNTDGSKDYKARVKIENRMGGKWKQKNAPRIARRAGVFQCYDRDIGQHGNQHAGLEEAVGRRGRGRL